MKVLKYGILALILLVVGVLVYVATIDLNDYRDEIAKQVESTTGRTLVIDGKLQFAASLIPTVVVEGVTLGNGLSSVVTVDVPVCNA